MAHITGGGLNENLSRIANGKTICIDRKKWALPNIFEEIKELEIYQKKKCLMFLTVVLVFV